MHPVKYRGALSRLVQVPVIDRYMEMCLGLYPYAPNLFTYLVIFGTRIELI